MIRDYGEFYEVTLDVPEHEKDNVRLTADKRKLTISMSRRFDGQTTDVYGDINKTKRTETYTKKLHVADLVDKKDVTSKYENGMLIFRIAKG